MSSERSASSQSASAAPSLPNAVIRRRRSARPVRPAQRLYLPRDNSTVELKRNLSDAPDIATKRTKLGEPPVELYTAGQCLPLDVLLETAADALEERHSPACGSQRWTVANLSESSEVSSSPHLEAPICCVSSDGASGCYSAETQQVLVTTAAELAAKLRDHAAIARVCPAPDSLLPVAPPLFTATPFRMPAGSDADSAGSAGTPVPAVSPCRDELQSSRVAGPGEARTAALRCRPRKPKTTRVTPRDQCWDLALSACEAIKTVNIKMLADLVPKRFSPSGVRMCDNPLCTSQGVDRTANRRGIDFNGVKYEAVRICSSCYAYQRRLRKRVHGVGFSMPQEALRRDPPLHAAVGTAI